MPITTSSTFDRIIVLCRCGESYLSGALVKQGADGDEVGVPNTPIGGTVLFDKSNSEVAEVLRRVELGTCAVYYYDRGATPDTWLDEDMPDGFQYLRGLHPFHPTDGWQFPRMFIDEGAHSVDDVTGRQRLSLTGDVVPSPRTPDTATFDYTLGEWYVLPNTTDLFTFRLDIDAGDELSLANIDTHPPVIALLGYLDSIRTAGAAYTGGVLAIGDLTRTYSILQNAGETVVFTIQTIVYVHHTYVTSISLSCTRSAGSAAYNASRLTDILDELTVSIATRDGIELPQFGGYEVPVVGGSWLIDEHRSIIPMNDNLLYEGRDAQTNVKYRVPISGRYGRSVDYSDLDIVNGRRVMPSLSFADTVHFGPGQTSDGDVQFPDPSELVPVTGVHRYYAVHNRNTTRNIRVRDWDGDTLLILTPGQFIQFQVTANDDGSDELYGIDPPFRVFLETSGETGANLSSGVHWDYSSAFWLRPLPTPGTAFADYIDTDTFNINGTESYTAGSQWSSNTAFFIPQAVRVLKDGEIEFNYSVELECQSSSGSMDSIRISLYRRRADGTLTEIDGNTYDSLSGDGNTMTARLGFDGFVVNGDTFFAAIRFAKSSSLSTNDVIVASHYRSVRVKPTIYKES